ncbi:creatininase [Sporosarcina sp. JAI121]|uniref:creatininase n=1 Tax=Sporosarcina sp. JAI121 TaxID=2723064 RepID=UPI0015CD4676|nr:creatininase [Sporosarcina sp. JAI121]NYF24333.1 creatinine amidohydrolase [Sporosarcina sp. JAI121]
MKNNMMDQMTWVEYEASTKEKILILPVGSTEQHGPHLPLGVDTIIATKIASAIAAQIPAVIAPTLSYGYKSQPSSGGGPLFPGTIDLNGSTLIALARDILDEFLEDGWSKIVIFNAHYENEAFLAEAADLLLRKQETEYPKIIIANWWDNVSPDVLSQVFDEVEFRGWALEHAALAETSMMMHFTPELVRMDLIPDDGIENPPTIQQFPPSRSIVPASGCLNTARSSSSQKGQLLIDDAVNNIVTILTDEFSLRSPVVNVN